MLLILLVPGSLTIVILVGPEEKNKAGLYSPLFGRFDGNHPASISASIHGSGSRQGMKASRLIASWQPPRMLLSSMSPQMLA